MLPLRVWNLSREDTKAELVLSYQRTYIWNFLHGKLKVAGSLTWLLRDPRESVSRSITALLGPELGNWYRITSSQDSPKFTDWERQGYKVPDIWPYSDKSHGHTHLAFHQVKKAWLRLYGAWIIHFLLPLPSSTFSFFLSWVLILSKHLASPY